MSASRKLPQQVSPSLIFAHWVAVETRITSTRLKKPSYDYSDLGWVSERGKSNMKLPNSIRKPNRSFVSVMLAFSMFGFFRPHHDNYAGQHHHANFMQQNEIRHPDDWSDGWYTPPRSPGFNGDFGS